MTLRAANAATMWQTRGSVRWHVGIVVWPLLVLGFMARNAAWMCTVVSVALSQLWSTSSPLFVVLGTGVAFGVWKYLLMDWSTLAALAVFPPAWPAHGDRPLHVPERVVPGWSSLIFAEARVSYVAALAGLGWLSRAAGGTPNDGVTTLALVVLNVLLFVVYRRNQGAMKERANLLLLRRYHHSVSRSLRRSIIGKLGAFGGVHSPDDGTMRGAMPRTDDGMSPPTAEARLVTITGPWEAGVQAMIERADVVVIDVSVPSPAVAWEIATAIRSGTAVILIAHANMVQKIGFAEAWIDAVADQKVGARRLGLERARALLSQVAPPIPYARWGNPVLSWRIFRALRSAIVSEPFDGSRLAGAA